MSNYATHPAGVAWSPKNLLEISQGDGQVPSKSIDILECLVDSIDRQIKSGGTDLTQMEENW